METKYSMESRFMEMLMNMQRCSDVSRALYDELKSDPRLNSIVVFAHHNGDHCFQVNFIKPYKDVYGISISYPMDLCRNTTGYPETIETALIDATGELCYMDELGYDDVCRFDSANDVVNEILRLRNEFSRLMD